MTENSPNSPERVHYLHTTYVTERGYPPAVDPLARLAGCSAAEAGRALTQLSDMHGVILEPGSTRVWSLHPFALTPTSFWVSTDDGRGWWANCAWCALGVAAALKRDVTISTRD